MRRSMVVVAAILVLSCTCYAAEFDLDGLIQARYTDERGELATFTASTARLGAEAKVTDKVSVRARFELAGEPNLLEAMIDYSFSKSLTVRVGQFKLPFGFETQISKFDLEAINRSLVISHLWQNGVSSPYLRDAGVLIMGRYKVLEYRVGAVNGVGYDYSGNPQWGGVEVFPIWGRDNNSSKDIVGRIGIGVPMLAGLGFSFYEGKWRMEHWAEACGEERTAKALDIFLDTGKVLFEYEHVWAKGRVQPSAWLYGPPEGSTVEEISYVDEWQPNKYGGYYIVIGYRLRPLIEPVFKVDVCDPNKDADGDRLTDMYFGLNLNFQRRARFQVFYRESKVAKRYDTSGFLAQVSAKL